jgi:hypothetical protein
MKHAVLTSVAHNVADSLACGIGLMIGFYEGADVFGEATHSPEGFIEVDFLAGTTTGATPSRYLSKTIKRYAEALPGLCERQGVALLDFKQLKARYLGHLLRREFVVEIEDRAGRRSKDRYVGLSASRPKVLDARGRVRRLKSG